MAKALPQGRPMHRRALFGLFDADGWGWATTKAFLWLLIIVMILGYIPDRAYYFVVSRTIDLGIMGWSPVNLCPPENGANMPCPVPVGGIEPWQGAGEALPAARTNGSAAQLGTNLLYIGGTDAVDGGTPAATTYLAQIDTAAGNFGSWSEGPALPEGRSDAALATLSGTAYLIGGLGPDGAPTDTVWSIGLDPDTSQLGTWAPVQLDEETPLTLPEPRSGASAVAVTDGLVVAGGRNADGAPVATVWKSTLDDDGVLGEFKEVPSLAYPVADATLALEGTFLWLYGGSDANGPVGGVQRAQFGEIAAEDDGHGAAATPTPAPSGEVTGETIHEWQTDAALNLPAARTGAGGFAANGALYLVGGSDGSSANRELYWALPDATGALPGGWRHLDVMDLPEGVENASAVTSGSTVFLLGGDAGNQASTGGLRASLAPEEPFFQLGLVGLVIPALQIPGEIGQQLGYLAAAGVGTGNFVALVAIAWAFNHKPMIRAWWERRKLAKEAKAPTPPEE